MLIAMVGLPGRGAFAVADALEAEVIAVQRS